MPRPTEPQDGAHGRPRRKVGLWPREHGAYVQLLAPLACAVVFAPRSLMAGVLVAAACAAFLAHEPLLILLGRRGERARNQCAPAAFRRLLTLAALVVSAAGWFFWSGDRTSVLALGVPLLLSLLAAGAVLQGHERELWAQLLSAATLASFSIPVLVAAGLSLSRALSFALGWVVVHLTGTWAARAYVYRRKHGSGALKLATMFGMAALLGSAALCVGGWLPWSVALASAPFVALALLLLGRVLEFKSPKTLGWTLTGANLVAFVVFGLDLLSA